MIWDDSVPLPGVDRREDQRLDLVKNHERTKARIRMGRAQGLSDGALMLPVVPALGIPAGCALGVLVVIDEKTHAVPVAAAQKCLELLVVVPPVPASATCARGRRGGDDDDRDKTNRSPQSGGHQYVSDNRLFRRPLDEHGDLPHEPAPSRAGRPPRRFISHRVPVE